MNHENPKVVTYAGIALVHFGPAAVPEVIKALGDGQRAGPARDVLVRIVRLYPPELPRLAEALGHENPAIRGHTARALGDLGGEATAALPALLRIIQDPDDGVRAEVAEAIGRIGVRPDFVPQLVEGLADPQPRVRAAMAITLSRLSTIPPSATPHLLMLLEKDGNDQVRAAAALALGKLSDAKESGPVVGALRKALADPVALVRARSAAAIGSLAARQDPTARAAIADLLARLKDEDDQVRQSVATALGNFGSAGQPAVAGLTALLQEPEANLRRSAVSALDRLAQAKVAGAAQGLAQAIRDQDRGVRQSALAALGQLGGPEAVAAIPAVLQIIEDGRNDFADRQEALHYIGQLGEAGQSAIPLIAQLLKDPDSDLRLDAANTLARIGPPAVPTLTETLKDSALQSVAAHGLAQMGPAAKEAVPALMALVQNPKAPADARANAAIALARVNPKLAAPAAPALADAARDPAVRTQALDALIRIGEPALPHLAALMAQKNSVLRQEIFMSLRKIGGPAVPFLVKLLEDQDNGKELREGAIKSLAAIGPAAQGAVPALKEAVNDPDADISKAAATALASIGK